MTAARPAKGVVVNVSPAKEPSDKQQAQEGDANKGKGKGSKGKGSPSTDPPNDLKELNDQLTSRFPDHSAFPYAAHIGTIGMGSGVYLGGGYILTSAHVGCYPFITQDGKIYRPDYKSWRILKQSNGASADLAIFRIKDPESTLADLAPIPLASTHPQKDDLVILIGNGLVQNAKPVGVRSGKKLLAVLGYRIEGRRAAIGGLNTVGEVINQPIKTSEFQTDCFSTSFDRNGFEAQAADGDSGGASFVYNSQLARWEIAGCIIAVSQADGFIPFGSRTYLANLTRYAGQLPNASGELDTGLPLGLASTSVDSSSPSESLAEDVIQVNPATIDVPPMPMPMETGEESSESSDGMLM